MRFSIRIFVNFVNLDRWGRRWLAFGTMVMSGTFSLLATAVPVGGYSATMAILGRFSVNISYNIGLQYCAEILPTVRNKKLIKIQKIKIKTFAGRKSTRRCIYSHYGLCGEHSRTFCRLPFTHFNTIAFDCAWRAWHFRWLFIALLARDIKP